MFSLISALRLPVLVLRDVLCQPLQLPGVQFAAKPDRDCHSAHSLPIEMLVELESLRQAVEKLVLLARVQSLAYHS